MSYKQLHTFIFKMAIFFTPVLLILIFYVITDPFKVLRDYPDYYRTGLNPVTLNKDYVSTKTLIRYDPVYHYNSFIFGNSRSIFYEINTWKKYLPSDAVCYHFDASGETLYGIHKKFIFLDRENRKIKNVLIVLDYSTLKNVVPIKTHLCIPSPQLTGENKFQFHLIFFKAFMNPLFLGAFTDYTLTGKIREYMKKDNIFMNTPFTYETLINEERQEFLEKEIAEGRYYTPERMEVFFPRSGQEEISPAVIRTTQKNMLTEINCILKRHRTDCKIIISPLYNQVCLNPDDIHVLQEIFGINNVFDFSGINTFTDDYHNYYESSHYRPHIAARIMQIVYENSQN